MFRSANHSCFGLLNNNKRKSVTGENARPLRKRENGRGAGEETRGRESERAELESRVRRR